MQNRLLFSQTNPPRVVLPNMQDDRFRLFRHITHLFLPTLLIILLFSFATAGVQAKAWEQCEIAKISDLDGPSAIAVVGNTLAVAYINGTDVKYATYNPALDMWTSEVVSSNIPSEEVWKNYGRIIRLEDWDGRPAIAWSGRTAGNKGQFYAVYFAYRSMGKYWRIENVCDEVSKVGGFDFKISPKYVPYIAASGYNSGDTPIALYYRTGYSTWKGEWVDYEDEDDAKYHPSLAFDNGLPRVAYRILVPVPNHGLWYAWKDNIGEWHRHQVYGKCPDNTHINLMFTSDHHPYIVSQLWDTDVPQDWGFPTFLGIYDNGEATNPWTYESPGFSNWDGLTPSAIMEYRQDGDYIHIAYTDYRYKNIGYIVRSPSGYSQGQVVAYNAPAYNYYHRSSEGPHITLFHESPAIVYEHKDGTSTLLSCSRYVDPVPQITRLDTTKVRVGTVAKLIKITGINFKKTDKIYNWDEIYNYNLDSILGQEKKSDAPKPYSSLYISPTERYVVLLGSDLAIPNKVMRLTVMNDDGRIYLLDNSNGIYVYRSPPPNIISVNPSSGPSNKKLTVTVTGSDFYGMTPEEWQPAPYPSVFLRNLAGHPDNKGTVTDWSETTLKVVFKLPTAGTYDVVVRNPDGQEDVLSKGFTVK